MYAWLLSGIPNSHRQSSHIQGFIWNNFYYFDRRRAWMRGGGTHILQLNISQRKPIGCIVNFKSGACCQQNLSNLQPSYRSMACVFIPEAWDSCASMCWTSLTVPDWHEILLTFHKLHQNTGLFYLHWIPLSKCFKSSPLPSYSMQPLWRYRQVKACSDIVLSHIVTKADIIL